MPGYLILGLNHKFAPLELRERLAYADRRIPAALKSLRDAGSDEAAIISTCNRVEVVAFGPEDGARERMLGVLATDHAFTTEYLGKFCYFHAGPEAVRHLMRVCGGLDSLVLGETQILAQAKRAYLMAQTENATGKALNGLFHRAFNVAKRLHTETEIGRGQLSISSVAVGYVDRVFEDLKDKTALLIGAGEVGELTLTYLRDKGIGRTIIVSRTHERARELAQRFGGDAVPFELLNDYLPRADIVVSQTSSETAILDGATFARSQKKRGHSPVFVLDLAVPRDIAPDAAEVDGVFLYNVDDLEEVVAENAVARSKQLELCNAIIRDEAEKFLAGQHAPEAGELIAALRERAHAIRRAESQRLMAQMPGLTDEQKAGLERTLETLVNKLLHPQIVALKQELAGADSARMEHIREALAEKPEPEPTPEPRP